MPCKEQVKLSSETKKKLVDLKIHFRETFEDVIIRLIKKEKQNGLESTS